MEQTRRLQRHHAALGALSRSAAFASSDRDTSLHEITETAARTLGVDRVSVWLFDDARSALRCVDLYERERGHSQGAVVTRAEHPTYFQAAESTRALDVDDVLTDPRTAELVDGYMRPLGIGALVDAPIVVGGTMIGVVCHEAVGGPRAWHPEELVFCGSIADFAAIAIERARRAEADASLRHVASELELALDSARMGTWAYDVAQRRVRWSSQVGPLFGQPRGWEPDPTDMYAGMFVDGDRDGLRRLVWESLDGRGPFSYRYRIRRADGTVRWVEARGHVERGPDGTPLRVLGTIADVTDAQRLQEQLLQSQKLEGLGRLAGGIAHDFNNLVTAITSCVEMLEEHLGDDPEALSLLGIIDKSADRAADLTRRLLAFASRQAVEPRVVDLGEVLADLEKMLGRLVREDVRLEVQRAPGLLPLRIDPTQLEQVVVNLVVNASDAMPDGGRLVLRADAATVAPDDVRLHADAVPGPHVRLTVTDTGIGMDEATLGRIFEPFFTTKPEGRGTGLGLATAYGIARQAGGHFRVTSAPDSGSAFEVWFPRYAGVTEPAKAPAVGEDAAYGGSETVLLVEDDPRVRDLASAALRARGYQVLEARDGDDALATALAWPGHIDLVVSDVVMPERGGRWLVDQLVQRDPSIRVLLMSGYPEDLQAVGRSASLLAKPFTASALLRAVRTVLDGP